VAGILNHYQDYFSEVTLKPSSGGLFEVSVDGKPVFSKMETDRFPGERELDRLVAEAVGAEPEE
jgi:selenoprotein W-related protein